MEKEKILKKEFLLTEEELAAEYTITGETLVSLMINCLVSFFAAILEGRAKPDNKDEIYDIWSRFIRKALKISDPSEPDQSEPE